MNVILRKISNSTLVPNVKLEMNLICSSRFFERNSFITNLHNKKMIGKPRQSSRHISNRLKFSQENMTQWWLRILLYDNRNKSFTMQ
ncbi:hypothetical protein A3Q56_07024 [Intoshia linei]|uniref:Uncharacterized protein n=1 Tax=Intoshia linei TaxID=1819745 RepID=A0A177ATE2_9BILA|nr:hypothetical protein A3Q56_07024 [Intoshia linei]